VKARNIHSFNPSVIHTLKRKTGRAIKEEREITTLPSHCQNIKTTTAYEKFFVKTYDSNIRR
jgi:hypothetical protein